MTAVGMIVLDMAVLIGSDGVTAPRRHLVCQGGSATIHEEGGLLISVEN